jgi:hypothetical protein
MPGRRDSSQHEEEEGDRELEAEDETKETDQNEAPEAEEAEPKGLMGKSGLTETDRRNLRKKQRDLLKEMEDREQLDVKQARHQNNELYKHVCFTREAVLDGDNLTVIVQKASQQVDRLIQVKFHDDISDCFSLQ